uniref:Uncharacterized protein n=1 Tax=Micrurus spixii TaxID=129469 RepID=A0A2D4MTU6_9SAUR
MSKRKRKEKRKKPNPNRASWRSYLQWENLDCWMPRVGTSLSWPFHYRIDTPWKLDCCIIRTLFHKTIKAELLKLNLNNLNCNVFDGMTETTQSNSQHSFI